MGILTNTTEYCEKTMCSMHNFTLKELTKILIACNKTIKQRTIMYH